MPHVRAVQHLGGYGFDEKRSLLVVPQRGDTAIYLIAGEDLSIEIDDESVASIYPGTIAAATKKTFTDWEKKQSIRPFMVYGKKTGSTVLKAFSPDRRPMIMPLNISVVQSKDHCQADNAGKITEELKEEIRGLSWRDALMRVAEDQMNSKIGRQPSGGDGKYDSAGVAWCGSFVWWCYDAVARAKGQKNPFGSAGGANNPLRSGIKALSWGIIHPLSMRVIRYKGYDPFRGKKRQEDYYDISWQNPVWRGDICLPRSPSGGWPHVCMVHDGSVVSGPFKTIDGNQTGSTYSIGSPFQCIGINQHPDVNAKIADKKTYKYSFIHVELPDDPIEV